MSASRLLQVTDKSVIMGHEVEVVNKSYKTSAKMRFQYQVRCMGRSEAARDCSSMG